LESSSLKAMRLAVAGCVALFAGAAFGSENVPHKPFAAWADVPARGQIVAGLVYEESEAYHIYAGGQQHSVRYEKGGEDYGIDINQGYLTAEYGITERWALDLSVGWTTCGSRYFSGGDPDSTTGLMDISFGARYQLMKEDLENHPWWPTLAFRAGAVLPGTYEKDFPFAPGLRAAAIEPELLGRKHFAWQGFGAYGDALYRWNRTTGNDQYIVSVGFFQQIKGWELDAGYRHLQTIFGDDIVYNPDDPSSIDYPRAVREINDAFEAGFSYTTARSLRFGFHTRTILDGSNTDQKFWIGGSMSIAFGGKKKETPGT